MFDFSAMSKTIKQLEDNLPSIVNDVTELKSEMLKLANMQVGLMLQISKTLMQIEQNTRQLQITREVKKLTSMFDGVM